MSFGVTNVPRMVNWRTIKSRPSIDSNTIEIFSQSSVQRIQDIKNYCEYFYSLFPKIQGLEKHFFMTGEQLSDAYRFRETSRQAPEAIVYLLESTTDFENELFAVSSSLWSDLTFDMEDTIRHTKQKTGITGKWYSKKSRIIVYATYLNKEGLLDKMEYLHEQANYYMNRLHIKASTEECIRLKRLRLVHGDITPDETKMGRLLAEGWEPVGNALLQFEKIMKPHS